MIKRGFASLVVLLVLVKYKLVSERILRVVPSLFFL